jgi:hypothetical protein
VDEPHRDISQPGLRVAPPSLKAAVRVARTENAERSEVVAELRGAEMARLEMLLEALEPVLAQVPKGIDLFDTAIAPGDHPRLFIDMIGFVEMCRNRRAYRFVQDTRVGRVTIAETERLDSMVDSVTAYIARRLIERDQALAADRSAQVAVPAESPIEKPGKAQNLAATPLSGAARPRRNLFGRALQLVVEILGSIVLFCIIVAAAFFAYKAIASWVLARHGSSF